MTSVTIYSRTYPPDVYCGAGVHVEHLTSALARIMPTQVRCFGGQDIEDGMLRVRGCPEPGRLIAPSDERFRRAIDALVRSALIAQERPLGSLVHCHDWYVMQAGLWAKMLWNLPLVVTAHSLEPMRPWKRGQVGEGGYALSSWMERTAVEAADRIIAVSEHARSDVLRHMPVDPDCVEVINNGVDTTIFHPEASADLAGDFGIDVDKPYILFVGRLTEQKGLPHLLNAMRFLPRDVQLVVCAGAADTPDLRENAKRLFAEIASDRTGLFWLEGLSGSGLAPLYAGASVFCCPSIYETFAIVNLEAMACGTPVVAADVGGNSEQLQHGETGFLVPLALTRNGGAPKDEADYVRSLADELTRVLENEDHRRAVGDAARRFVEARCSWQVIARRTAALYDDVLRTHARCGGAHAMHPRPVPFR